MPSLQAIAFDTSELDFDRDEPNVRRWFSHDGDIVSLHLYPKAPDCPPDLRSLEQLRSWCLLMLKNSDAAASLVEVAVASIDGLRASRVIAKAPQPHGRTGYFGTIAVPFRNNSLAFRVECPDRGVPGAGDSLVFQRLFAIGRAMSRHPTEAWNPDRERYDPDFPQHPISRARRLMNRFAETCAIGAALRSQARPWDITVTCPLLESSLALRLGPRADWNVAAAPLQ